MLDATIFLHLSNTTVSVVVSGICVHGYCTHLLLLCLADQFINLKMSLKDLIAKKKQEQSKFLSGGQTWVKQGDVDKLK